MSVSFIILIFFVFWGHKISVCEKSKSETLNKFNFNNVNSLFQSKDGADTTTTYPIIKDLADTDEYVPPFVNSYDDLTYPNPFVEPEKCVLYLGISHSWICDPQQYLTLEDQIAIEAALLKIRDTNFHKCSNKKDYYYQVALALVPQIIIKKNESFENASRAFAYNLLKKWGIGNKQCHDGILIVYIRQLGKFVLAKREGVEDAYINETEIKNKFINTYFATGSLSKALLEAIELIHTRLPSQPQELTNTAKLFLVLIILYVISIIILYFTTSAYNKKK